MPNYMTKIAVQRHRDGEVEVIPAGTVISMSKKDADALLAVAPEALVPQPGATPDGEAEGKAKAKAKPKAKAEAGSEAGASPRDRLMGGKEK